MNEEFDPKIKALAQAIKKQESGGHKDPYNAVGDNGTSRGAYQFQDATWKAWAKKHLGDENAKLTVENQNKVAYYQIKEFKEKGYNPAQIAAAWNAGEGRLENDQWKTWKGTTTINGKEIAYDTPKYVENVSKYFREYAGTQQYGVSQGGTPKAEEPGLLGSIGNAITDPVLSLGGGVANVIRKASGFETSGEKIPSLFGGEGVNPVGYRDGKEVDLTDTTKQLVGNVAMAGSNLVGGGIIKSVGTGILSKISPSILALMKQGATATGLQMGGQASEEGKSTEEIAKETAKGTVIGGIAGPVIGKTIGVVAKIPGAFKVKTAEEILSTPIEKLPTLSTTERSFYFSTKAEQINKNYQEGLAGFTTKYEQEAQKLNKMFDETTTNITKSQDVIINNVKTRAESLSKELADASIAEVEALKPKLTEAMRKSSDTYRKLVDEEISAAADTQVTNNEIASFIRNRYEFDQPKAEQLISLLKSKTEGPQTVRSVYESTKNLRQDISKSATQGNRTLTASEYNTTEAISELLDFLKIEKGVDLSKANKFWAEYSPIKNKLFKAIQPYKPSGSETASFKTFAKTLVSNDPYNQNFIKATEKLLGVSFKDSKAREILSKIDATEKAKIASKIESSTRLQQEKAKKLADSIKLKENLKQAKTSLKLQREIEENKQELIKLTATLKAERRLLLKRIVGGILVIGIGKQATDIVLGGF